MTAAACRVDPPRFTRHLFRLRFSRPARFAHFLHGGAVHGLLGHALRDRHLPTGLVHFGRRVQLSVFECRLEHADLDRVVAAAEAILESPENGDLRIYRWCASCRDASTGLGSLDDQAEREIDPACRNEEWP